ncbi:cytochrome c peroxidase [Spirosomataceae bacterium TFI 002]|nr:cytochrome c peroxidase [Spirosomataceae bacterium TFI 002]
MKKYLFGLFTLGLALNLTSCKTDIDNNPEASELDISLTNSLETASNGIGKEYYILPESNDFAAIPQDPKNPLSAAKVELGKLLYHETGLAQNPVNLSGMNTYSCASCHHAAAGFQACVAQGMGEGGSGFGAFGESRKPNANYKTSDIDVQPLRSPSILNIAYQELVLWNGQFGATGANVGTEDKWHPGSHPIAQNFLGFEGVETQALAGREVHRLVIDKIFMSNIGNYKQLYEKAFDPASFYNPTSLKNNSSLAIAAYERVVLANQSPFQLWLRGNNGAMSEDEKKGALLFFGKGNCASCHNGPSLANMEFHAYGMKDLKNGQIGNSMVINVNPNDAAHLGRGGFTGVDSEKYEFKVPQLYNLKDSPFYGHGASFSSVKEVIMYKNLAKKENDNVPDSYLSSQFKPLNLTSDEIEQLTVFIENALRDPNLTRYVPSKLPSGLGFPNNDKQTRVDLGF